MRLDHLSYAAGPEGIGACVQRLGSTLGAAFFDGGLHPRFGTRNFVLPPAGGVYLEVVEALDHPAADKAPFGQAVKARSAAGGGWLAWVIAVDDIEKVEHRLGRLRRPLLGRNACFRGAVIDRHREAGAQGAGFASHIKGSLSR